MGIKLADVSKLLFDTWKRGPGAVNYMLRLNHDGTVTRCDDCPDPVWLGNKYAKSSMRPGMWVEVNQDRGSRKYIEESEVPKPILMAELIGI